MKQAAKRIDIFYLVKMPVSAHKYFDKISI